jgi:tetratricopeptide (TPR) repeat protein
VLVVAVASVVGAVHLAHQLQVARNARLLLVLADRREAAGKLGEAAGTLSRYVRLVPDDTDALARLGQLNARLGNSQGAFALLEQVLRRQPGRDEARRQLVDVAMKMGRFSDAREHLRQYILRDNPGDTASLDLLGQCEAALGELKQAADTFEQVLKSRPDSLETYSRLADLRRLKLDQPAEADAAMDRLVESNRESHEAWLSRAKYRDTYLVERATSLNERSQALALAVADIRQAVALAPSDLDSLLLAAKLTRFAESARDSGADEARQYIERGIELHPSEPRLYRAMAELELDGQRRDAALAAVRRGLERLPGQSDLLWTLAELLILDGELDTAAEVLAQLRADEPFSTPADYLAARIEIARGRLVKGSEFLESLRPKLAEKWPELAKQADFWAGWCYDRLEKVDEQLAAYRRAVSADRQWALARLGLAGSLLKIGRFDEAVEECRLAAAAPGFPVQGLNTLARMMIVQRLRSAPSERDWRAVEQVLEAASAQMPDSLDLAELRAEVLLAQEQVEAARSCLAEASERWPERVQIWLSRAALEDRLGEGDAAEQLLSTAEARLGDSVDLRVGRARHLAQRIDSESVEPLKALALGIDEFADVDQSRLATVLALALMAAGDKAEALELAKQANAKDPDNLPARLIVFDMALANRDATVLDDLLADIRRIEGPEGGPLWHYGEALRLVLASEDDQQALQQARNHLTLAKTQRPAWARLPLLEAQIEEIRANASGAIDLYQQAIELGLRHPPTTQRLVGLLFAQRRFAEADQALRKLEEQQTPFTSELSRLASKVSLQVEDFTRALEMARKTCATSTNSADHLWLGQLAGALARGVRADAANREKLAGEAGAAFSRAVELAPNEPEAWVALLQHLVRTEQAANVDEALAEASRQIAPDELPLVLAQCYDSMGRTADALEQYRMALEARDDDVVTLRRAAEFHINHGANADAEPLLRRLIAPEVSAAPADLAFGRRGLAFAIAADKNYLKLRQAIGLVDENLKENPGAAEDRRAKAVLLSLSPGKNDRREAISILEEMLRQAAPDESVRLLLAQLYRANGEVPQARRQMQSLLAAANDNVAYITSYVRLLLERSEIDEADLWVARLEKLQPQALETNELRARILVAEGRAASAIELLAGLVGKSAPKDAAQTTADEAHKATHGKIALLMEDLAHNAPRPTAAGKTAQAEGPRPPDERANDSLNDDTSDRTPADISSHLLLQAAEDHLREEAAAEPRGRVTLAAFLGRQRRVTEALAIWDELWSTDDYEAAAIGCAGLAATRQLSAPQLDQTERRLTEANSRHPESLPVLAALARISDTQGEYPQAAAFYRRILAQNGDDLLALNNLALNLALRKKDCDEALKLIDRALRTSGPVAALLDSRATVHLANGNAERAIVDLEEAIGQVPKAAYYFHLAQAYLLKGDRKSATTAFERAKDAGLGEQSLHALERDEYRKVLASLAGAG